MSKLSILLILLFSITVKTNAQNKTIKAEVVIYGGTSTAIATAIQLVRMNKKVVIVCPEKHIGGMSASGLGFTDIGNKAVIGGISKEFYQRIYAHYQNQAVWKWQPKKEYGNEGQGTTAINDSLKTMWTFEPHVAEGIFESFIKENKIKIYRDKWLNREKGVEMKDGKIVSITMLTGEKFMGKIFVDATYEGDLMAAAGISYHVGREANSVYNEEWNGVQKGKFHHGHNFGKMKISPYKIEGDPNSGVIPRISAANPGNNGDGDKQVQVYCYRTCLTNAAANKTPWARPANYDSTQYELLVRILKEGWSGTLGGGPNVKMDTARQIVMRVATQNGAKLMDLFQKFSDINVPKHNEDRYFRNIKNSGKNDGVHPTDLGYQFIAEAVFEYLKSNKLIKKEIKILCFGDSITYGSGSKKDKSYPSVLSNLIAAYFKN